LKETNMTTTLQRGINSFVEQIDAPTAAFFTSCVHCGLCADACLFYTETQDPKYTPIYKLAPMRRVWQQKFTFWGKLMSLLGLSKPVTDAELAEWEPLVYDSCTLCGRCSLACPVGNDIVYMVRKMREGMVASGHAPEGLKGATKRAIELGSPMGITLATLQAHIKHAEKETGLPVPLDKEGADYMLVLSSAEIAEYSEIIPAVTRIFHQAGVSWTMASDGFEGTNSGIQIGSSDLAAEIVGRIVRAAERLKVKYVISPECGHAYTALRWEGPNLIGRPYPFEVIHIIELLDNLRAGGLLRTEGLDETKMTFHDPCQMVRRGGVIEQPRRLLKMVAPNFVGANERADELRLRAFNRKRAQLSEIDVNTIVTSCSNCRSMLQDGLDHNHMDTNVVGLTELIAEHLAPSK
jgi:Fe-S oxidoreductase